MAVGSPSGTYAFNPDIASLTVEAFERCGIHATALTRQQLASARRSLNLELVSWANRGVNLWEVKPFTLQIVAGQANYTAGSGVANISANTVSMLDVYRSIINGGGTGVNIDNIMLPISRQQYAELPNKLQSGTPTVYWYQKQESPILTVWQPPISGYPTWSIGGYYLSRIQDASAVSGQTPDVPYRGLDALSAGLARRLAVKFAPERLPVLTAESKEAWLEFADADREDTPIYYQPNIAPYFR